MAWTRRDATAMFQRMVEERHHEMARNIVRLRSQRGWTQPDLAHEAGVSIGTISRLENAKHEGRGGTLRAVAKALEVDVQDLLPGAEPEQGELSQLDRIEEMLKQILSAMNVGRDALREIAADTSSQRTLADLAARTELPAPSRRGSRRSA